MLHHLPPSSLPSPLLIDATSLSHRWRWAHRVCQRSRVAGDVKRHRVVEELMNDQLPDGYERLRVMRAVLEAPESDDLNVNLVQIVADCDPPSSLHLIFSKTLNAGFHSPTGVSKNNGIDFFSQRLNSRCVTQNYLYCNPCIPCISFTHRHLVRPQSSRCVE